MIIRQLCRRQGRALLRSSPATCYRRPFSTEDAPPPPPIQEHALPFNRPELHSVTHAKNNIVAERPEQITTMQPEEGELSPQQLAEREFTKARDQRIKFHELGSWNTHLYRPEKLISDPPRPSDITLERLLACQAHLGHAISLWNPENSAYIYGVRQGVHIISLEVTAAYLRRAAKVVEEVARRGGLILFVGTRPGQHRIVVKAAELAQGCHIFERWIPGTITNGNQVLGETEMKVVDEMDNEIPELRKHMAERAVLRPDLVVVLNPLENEVVLHECGLYNIPTIGIIDTDANPARVTYPIPANDDSLRCVAMIAGVLGRAGEQGQARRLEESQKGKVPYQRVTMAEITGEEGRKEKSREKEEPQGKLLEKPE